MTYAPIRFGRVMGVGTGAFVASVLSLAIVAVAQETPIVHDTEYYILQAQNADRWSADDTTVDARIAEFRAKNDGKGPNVLYILIDDIGFGDLGNPRTERNSRLQDAEHQHIRRRRHASGADVYRAPPAHQRAWRS